MKHQRPLLLTLRLLLVAQCVGSPPRLAACTNDPALVMDPFNVNETPVWQSYSGPVGVPTFEETTRCWVTTWESYSYANTPNGVIYENYDTWPVEGECLPPIVVDVTNPPSDDDTCPDANPFRIFDGNAMRKIHDLEVLGAAGGKLSWTRHHNTVTRDGLAYFGVAGSWRHSWQYDLIEHPLPTGRAELELIYPDGLRRVFSPQDGAGWAPPPSCNDHIAATANGFLVTTPEGASLKFIRKPAGASAGRYEMQTLTDVHGLGTQLDYNGDGYLTKVTEPAGRTLTASYRALPFQRGVFETFGVIGEAPKRGAWIELTVPADFRASSYEHLRLRAKRGTALAVAEVQFFGQNSTAFIKGSARGTGSAPSAAFDGDESTVFSGARESVNVCGLSLPSGQTVAVARVRILAAPGQEAALIGATVEGLRKVASTRAVVSRVVGSDGRAVDYGYDNLADPVTGHEFLGLTSAAYGDATSARYRYDFVTAGKRPLMVEADDPRNPERAKRVRYAYHDEPGMIHQEINPATGGVYVSLELDRTNPDKRIVHYSDLRSKTYLFPKSAGGRSTETTDSLGRVVRREFDQNGAGHLVASTDHAGRKVTYTYDQGGHRNTAAKDNQARGARERDERGLIVKGTDRFGQVTAYERDARSRVTRVVTPDGAAREFTYDDLGRVTAFRQRDGGVHRFTFNQRGLKSAWTTPKGETIRYGYDAQDRLIAITDPLGQTTRREVNERGLTTKITAPDGRTRQFAYDNYGRKTAETDEQGQTTKLAYDELGRLVRQEDPVGRATAFDYTELPQGCGSCTLVNHPSRMVSSDGSVTKYLYDSEGRILARTVAADTPAQATITYTYDHDDHVLSSTDPLGRTTRYTYDDEGNRLSLTDALGRVTKWTYDDHNNVLTVTAPDAGVTKRTYDALDRLTRSVDAAGNSTRYDYDDLGNIVALTDATGSKTRTAYDGRRPTSRTYADGKKQTWTYDALGRVMKTISPDGIETTTTYDSGGRVLSTADSTGRKSTFVYDALGRRTAATDPLGRITRWSYDSSGNVLTTTRPDGVATGKTYDAQNHVLSETDAAGQVTRYDYDVAGNQTALTDANRHTYRFTYDALHRKSAMIYPDDSRETWAYDLAGNLVAFTNRAGQTKTTTYNAGNQPVSETWSHASSPLPAGLSPSLPAPTSYTYDSAGRLQGVDNGNAKLAYAYDPLGRIASETSDLSALVTGLGTHTVNYRYDELGRRSDLIYPDRTKVSYAYDARGRLTTIDSNGGGRTPLATYDYTPLGQIAKLTRDNGVATAYTYDMAGQLTDITHAKAGTVLASARYMLDALGRRTAQTREDGLAESYGYDATGQLTGVDYGDARRETFAYDPVGNRTQTSLSTLNLQPSTTSYSTNALNQYTQLSVGNVVTAFSYDANGNLTNDGKQLYGYDAQNRLLTLTSAPVGGALRPDSVKGEFSYDARNRCVLRKYYTLGSQGQWILNQADSRALTYDPAWNLLAERQLNGAQVGAYIHGQRTDEILVANLKSKTLYPLADGLGSTTAIVDDRGGLLERVRYEAYGQPRFLRAGYQSRIDSVTSDRFLFTAREWLSPVSISDHRNRYYSPELGRWLATDLIGLGAGINLYEYVNNSPVTNVDPHGLFVAGQTVAIVIGGTLVEGVVVNVAAGYVIYIAGTGYYQLGEVVGESFAGVWLGQQIADFSFCPECSPHRKGTIGYIGPHCDHDHYPIVGPHLNLFVVNQNPNSCQCYWNKNTPDAAVPPPQPGWVDLNGGFPPLTP